MNPRPTLVKLCTAFKWNLFHHVNPWHTRTLGEHDSRPRFWWCADKSLHWNSKPWFLLPWLIGTDGSDRSTPKQFQRVRPFRACAAYGRAVSSSLVVLSKHPMLLLCCWRCRSRENCKVCWAAPPWRAKCPWSHRSRPNLSSGGPSQRRSFWMRRPTPAAHRYNVSPPARRPGTSTWSLWKFAAAVAAPNPTL